MNLIFLLVAFCGLVYGDCDFHSTDSKILQDNLKTWRIYKQILKVETDTSTYEIGICTSSSPADKGAITQRENKTDVFILGKLEHASLTRGDNWMLLRYTNGDRYVNSCGNETRSASIIFVCGQNTNVTVVQESTAELALCNYLFQIQVPEMCVVVPKIKKSLSGVAIFFIILLCLASIYFIGGFLFMRIRRGARGVDQIPNLDLWRRLGHAVAVCCDYCCRCKTDARRTGLFLDQSRPDMYGDDDILAP